MAGTSDDEKRKLAELFAKREVSTGVGAVDLFIVAEGKSTPTKPVSIMHVVSDVLNDLPKILGNNTTPALERFFNIKLNATNVLNALEDPRFKTPNIKEAELKTLINDVKNIIKVSTQNPDQSTLKKMEDELNKFRNYNMDTIRKHKAGDVSHLFVKAEPDMAPLIRKANELKGKEVDGKKITLSDLFREEIIKMNDAIEKEKLTGLKLANAIFKPAFEILKALNDPVYKRNKGISKKSNDEFSKLIDDVINATSAKPTNDADLIKHVKALFNYDVKQLKKTEAELAAEAAAAGAGAGVGAGVGAGGVAAEGAGATFTPSAQTQQAKTKTPESGQDSGPGKKGGPDKRAV